jgi:uncharacterized protein (DUF362 family)
MKKGNSIYSRREFISCLGVSLISFFSFIKSKSSLINHQDKDLLPPRSSKLFSNPNQNKSVVIIVEGKDINKMIRTGLEALELPEEFFKDKKIVIKPNTHWSEEYPSTTDPASLLPIIDFLREKKSGNITIADGSGVDLPNYRTAFEFIKFEKILAPKGVNIVPLNIWKLDDFISIKSSKWSILKTLTVHPIIYNAPILISMTCLKRHHVAYLTAALKNNMGALSARSRYHVHHRTKGKFKEAIAEVAHAIRPEITIIDARDILVKSGPLFMPDKSNLKRGINRLLISTDMAALDTIASQLMSEYDETFEFDMFQPTLNHTHKLKLGNIEPDLINIINLRV